MRKTIAVLLFASMTACGGGSSEPKSSHKVSKHEAKPKCPPGAEDMPKDARDKMASMQGSVRKCYTLGIGGGEADVKVEVSVSESGEVRDTRVIGASGHPTAVECLKKTMRGAKFAKFCGPDIDISWTYALR